MRKGDLAPNPHNAQAWIIGEPEIGPGTWIGAFTVIDGSGGLKIGRGCDISSGVHILTHSTAYRCITERRYGQVDRKPVHIGDYVFVGENATILMGAKIGHHSIVAAAVVVLEDMDIPPYSLVVGAPARVVRSIRDEIEARVAESCGVE